MAFIPSSNGNLQGEGCAPLLCDHQGIRSSGARVSHVTLALTDSVFAAAEQDLSEMGRPAQNDNHQSEAQLAGESHELGARAAAADQTLLHESSINAAVPLESHAASADGESTEAEQERGAAQSELHSIEQQLQQMALQPAQEGGDITSSQPATQLQLVLATVIIMTQITCDLIMC